MPRDALVRMEVDTRWLYHRRWRQVQREWPQAWPFIAVGWFALLGEAWHSRSRDVTLDDAWPSTLDVTMLTEARDALTAAGLLDKAGKIPRSTWLEWFGPTQARVEAGRRAAAIRWGNPTQSDGTSEPNAMAMPIGIDRERESGRRGRGVRGEGEEPRRSRRGGAPAAVGDVAAAMGFGDHYPDGTPRKGARSDA